MKMRIRTESTILLIILLILGTAMASVAPPCLGESAEIGHGGNLRLEDYILDDGSSEIYTGSSVEGLIIANRFRPRRPALIGSVSFYTSGVASGTQARIILYEDPTGDAQVPDASMEVWRRVITLGGGGFQEETTGGVVVNAAGTFRGAFYVGLEDMGTESYSMGIDMSSQNKHASFISIDYGETFEPLSEYPVIEGNAMIRAHEGEITYGDLAPFESPDGMLGAGDSLLSARGLAFGLPLTYQTMVLIDVAPSTLCPGSGPPFLMAPDPDGTLDASDMSVLMQAACGYVEIVPYCP